MKGKNKTERKFRTNIYEKKNDKLSRRNLIKALAGIPFLGILAFDEFNALSAGSATNLQYRIAEELGLNFQQSSLSNSQHPSPIKGDKLKIGFIGFGNRARALASGLGYLHPLHIEEKKKSGDLEKWMKQEDLNVELVGICDVFDLHADIGMETARNGLRVNGEKGTGLNVKRFHTYKDLLKDQDIDAVIIATPDHHHAQISTEAIKSGKHVYCEKSISLTEEELFKLYDTVKSSDRVFQLGHQIIQNSVFQQAKEVIDKNVLGKISLIETTSNRNSADGAWIRHLNAKGEPKPGNENLIDWNQWLGNAPTVPFSIDRFYNWTKFFDYNTGVLGQLFTHEYDAINQLLGIGIPKSVSSLGGVYYWKDNRDMPDVLTSVFDYPEKELTMTYSATLGNSFSRGRRIMGHDATMELGRSMKVTADKNSTQFANQIRNGTFGTSDPILTISPEYEIDAVSGATSTENYYASRGLTDTVINGLQIDTTHLHIKEWIDCIRYGGKPSDNIDKAFEEGITVLMAHKSYVEQRRVEWDSVQRKII
jgi:predicted dehydrogenase